MNSEQGIPKKVFNRNLVRRMFLCVLVVLLTVSCAQCGPAPDNNAEATAASTPVIFQNTELQDEAATSATPESTTQVQRGWSDTSSTATELSFSYPGDWFGPAKLPFGEGIYIKDPDESIGMIFQIELQGNPNELLDKWGKEPIDITGLLSMTPNNSEAGDLISVSRIDTPTRMATDGNIIAQCSYIARRDDVLQIVRFAPAEKWESSAAVFEDVLATVEVWNKTKIEQIDLQTMLLHDWSIQTEPEKEGVVLASPEGNSALYIRTKDVADPVQLLSEWETDILEHWGFADASDPISGERFGGLGGDWEALTGTCEKPDGTQMTYAISMIPNRDRVLEIIIYGPSANWEKEWSVFKVMLGMLVDLRP